MKSVKQRTEDLIGLLTDSLGDADKHGKGNFTAGGRVRKVLQQVVRECKDIRKQIQDERAERSSD